MCIDAVLAQQKRGHKVVAVADAIDPVEALERVLSEYGPLDEDDIAQRLREAGVADPAGALEQALDEISCPAGQLVDERWIWLPAVLAGRVFTHRLSAGEAAHDLLAVTPDLDPITALCDHDPYRSLADGSSVRIVLAGFDDELLEARGIPDEAVDRAGGLLLEPGTLAALGVAEGDLIALRLSAEGLVLERVTAPAQAAVGPRLAAVVDTGEDAGQDSGDDPEDNAEHMPVPELFDAAVWTVCVEDPAAFTEPLPPLSEIADEQGLTRHGDWLAPAGFDIDAWQFENGCARLALRHGLDPDDAFALYTLVQVCNQLSEALTVTDITDTDDAEGADEAWAEPAEVAQGDGAFSDLVADVGASLADPLLADLLALETVGKSHFRPAALGMFAESQEPKVPRAARVAFRWLQAVALERLGDIAGAERELLAAETMNPDWPLPLVGLARYASDRGDAERGLSLLRRAGMPPNHPLVTLLERHRAQPRGDIGRNEPCWCGSGRKYKKCHLGREELPLAERVNWLYTKAAQHAMDGNWRDLTTEVAYERARYDFDDGVDDALDTAMNDPLVVDAVLFEGGALADFLDVRGSLLPDDERLLAQQWLLAQRSVFEVEQVRRGHGMTVRDVRSGDVHEVQERTASRQLKPGMLVCTRVLPAGDSMQFFGGIEPVALHQRDALIDLLDEGSDPEVLVAELSRRFAPPTLTNTEGEPLALCEATVGIGEASEIEAALDEAYDRADGEEPPRWHEHVATHGIPHIRATLVLRGDTLQVETNSEQRMDRVLVTLARLDPSATVLDQTRRPVRDAREAAALAALMPPASEGEVDPNDPVMAAALDDFIRSYETRWLDEPIPALDGHTPRQAADDPTRRGDLIKLLDTFPGGAMDVDRLRAALGLR